MKIAYITYSGTFKYSPANNFNETQDLLPFLQNKGLDISAEIWDDPSVDWEKYDIALLKTPWDYHQKYDQFKLWLDKLQSLNIRLLNDYSIVRWNMDKHYLLEVAESGQLMDWLMANQLMKDKKTIALIESWEDSISNLQRRTFWYYQARLRWTGQTPPANTPELLTKIEANIAKEEPEVQWAMNFTAGWIGVYEKKYRNRCVSIGEKKGLYKGEMVSKGCTPNYLPEFIAIESNKRNL